MTEFNLFAEIDKVTAAYVPPKPDPCSCAAFDFPHRYGSGDCMGADPDAGLKQLLDHMLDDPRHGQAAGLNKETDK